MFHVWKTFQSDILNCKVFMQKWIEASILYNQYQSLGILETSRFGLPSSKLLLESKGIEM